MTITATPATTPHLRTTSRSRNRNAIARATASAAITGASTLSLLVVTPVAHADDPLPPIRSAVNGVRSGTTCPALNYNGDLEAAAQHLSMTVENTVDSDTYHGTVKGWRAVGDPEGKAIDGLMGAAGGLIATCQYKDFGVGFYRDNDAERDFVTVVLGQPTPPAPSPPPLKLPPPSDSVPAIPEPLPGLPPPLPPTPPVAPTDAVEVDFDREGLLESVKITNTADLAGKCTYVASPKNNPLLPTINRNFSIDAKGKAQLTVPAPPILTTYHAVVSCSGTFNGKPVEFGHDEQDVSG